MIARLALLLLLGAATLGIAAKPAQASTRPRVLALAAAAATPGTGELKSAERRATIGSADVNQILRSVSGQLPALAARYDVATWRLTYTTTDGGGKPVVASGLVAVPIKPRAAPSPVVSYQHATTFYDAEAPSNALNASEPPIILASLGYIVVAADYVGYGATKGLPHPYLVAAPSAAAVLDMLTAAATWGSRQGIADNGQLFLLGYSEGGYVTMAAHRAMQAAGSPLLGVLVGSAPAAGPYDVGATLDELLRRARSESPVLGALVSPGLLRFLGGAVRNQVRDQLFKRLLPGDTDVVFQTDFIDNFLADNSGEIDRQSNVHDWRPLVPVRMYHGRDDQTVPYVASVRTLQAMRARAAPDVQLTDCTAAPSSHLGCVLPWWVHVLNLLAPVARDL